MCADISTIIFQPRSFSSSDNPDIPLLRTSCSHRICRNPPASKDRPSSIHSPVSAGKMRLLNTENCELEEFGDNKIPLYAILSHTWGEHEITFQDVERGNADKKTGYEKIRKTCSIAAAHGFKYVWIDTCCIDKASSAELSEAINSMYRWYQGSGMCYAYLADVPPNAVVRQSRTMSPEFSKSRWFTRGWTLQELIAPSMVIFLDQEWQEIGTKSSLQSIISEITGIPDTVLQGADLESASVAQRMSWASKRETTRIEDLTYCLIGIFGVGMPMLYGEGERAFIRLQEEIMKISDDHSLFAWESFGHDGGLLAASPAAFLNSNKIIPLDSSSNLSGAITVNNKGIHLNLRLMDIDSPSSQRVELAVLPCGVEGELEKKVGIYVRARSESKGYFEKMHSSRLELINLNDFSQSRYPGTNICIRQERQTQKGQSPLSKAAEYGNMRVVKLLLEKGADLDSEDKHGQTPLLLASRKGNVEVVKLLLEKGANVESKDDSGWTPLLLAAAGKGNGEVVKLLLEKGADIESRDVLDRTPLSQAAEGGDEETVKLLLKKGADLESKDKYGQTPLSRSVEKGNKEIVKLLLKKGANLESKNDCGQTPLSQSAEKGNEEIVKLLLEKGANLESKDDSGRTSLSRALKRGDKEMVKLLLKKGADLESKDRLGQTPLSQASVKGDKEMMAMVKLEMVKLLLEKGADLESKDGLGLTPLSQAAEEGNEEIVKLLLKKGADFKSKDGSGQTPLSRAAEKGNEEIVKLLLKKGADLESKDKHGQTPLSRAAEKGNEEIVKLLLKKGADIESKDKHGRTPLSRSTEKGNEEIVKLLLEKGANLESEDEHGRTPLSRAAEKGNEEIVKLLLKKGADLESEDKYGQTPLLLASKKKNQEVVKLLLKMV
jgi:ankyrin repeat protein